MISHPPSLNADDHFILGNVALEAIRAGLGAEVQEVLAALKLGFPRNANAVLLEATYLDSIDETQRALIALESFDVFSADEGMEDAVAFHLYLLAKVGEKNRALALGNAYLQNGYVRKESACHMIRQVLEECEGNIDVAAQQHVTRQTQNNLKIRSQANGSH